LRPVDKETLDEVLRRLQRLNSQCGELIKLNNRLIEQRAPQIRFDPDTDTLTYRMGELEEKVRLNRADPKIPIGMGTVTVAGAYKPETTVGQARCADVDELAFEGLLEDYYHNAHRMLKLVKLLPGFKNFQCREITMVRNKLVEHSKQGEVYSFGWGSSGPVVRPLHQQDREWIDRGLVPNSEALLGKLAEAFAAV